MRVHVCECVWHSVSSREFHFTRRLSGGNSLHCLQREALIKPRAGPRRTINQRVFKAPKKETRCKRSPIMQSNRQQISHCMLNRRILTSVSPIGGRRCIMCQSGRPLIGASSVSVRQWRERAHRAPGDSVQILPPGTLFPEGLAKKPNEPSV